MKIILVICLCVALGFSFVPAHAQDNDDWKPSTSKVCEYVASIAAYYARDVILSKPSKNNHAELKIRYDHVNSLLTIFGDMDCKRDLFENELLKAISSKSKATEQ